MARFFRIGDRTLNFDAVTQYSFSERTGTPVLSVSFAMGYWVITGEDARAVHQALNDQLVTIEIPTSQDTQWIWGPDHNEKAEKPG
jgi:hypothetical protein